MTVLLITLGAAAGLAAWLALFAWTLRQPGARDVTRPALGCWICQPDADHHRGICPGCHARLLELRVSMRHIGAAFEKAAVDMRAYAAAWRGSLERELPALERELSGR